MKGGTVRAAGGVVTRANAGRTEVLVIHRPHRADWSLPKGKADAGEPDEAAAVREVLEETGLECRLGRELEAIAYTDRAGRPKRVRYWHMQVLADHGFAANAEVDELRWLPVAEAATLLSYAADRNLIRAAVPEADDPVPPPPRQSR